MALDTNCKMQVCDKKHGKNDQKMKETRILMRLYSVTPTIVMRHLSQHYGITWTLDYAVTSLKPTRWKVHVSSLRRKPLKDHGLVGYLFDYLVPLGFGSIAGGLDHVNPVIRLPLEHGISRVIWKDDHSNPELTLIAGIIRQTKDIYSGMSNAGQPETTVNEYLTKVRDDNGPGIAKSLYKFSTQGLDTDETRRLSGCQGTLFTKMTPSDGIEALLSSHTKGKRYEASNITLNEQRSAVVLNNIPLKEKDPGSFTIPCVIGQNGINKALADLGASISLIRYSMFLRLNLGELKPTRMCIELANKSTQIPKGIAENVIVKIDRFEGEKPTTKLKDLPSHLEYAFLDNNQELLVIISSLLFSQENELLLEVLTKHKSALAWKVADIKAFFHDMYKDFMEVFMDDFSVFGNSFDSCLNNLSKMLARCEETNLVLNWEKFHFMVKEGIVLGHKISKVGIKVDKVKVDVIAKLPYPTNIKGIRSFLGHVGFYRRFIKDFLKIVRPMTQLLMKDTKFIFSNDCIESFDILRNKLTTTPVIIAPNWNLDFELMCDASDYAEFTIEIKDKKGSENLAADHLSRLKNPELEELNKDAIRDSLPDEYLMVINIKEVETDSWYADYANFLVLKIIPQHLTRHLRKKFLSDVKKYIWDDPYLFKSCPDGIIRRCVLVRNYTRSSNISIQDQSEDIMEPILLQGRSSNLYSVGQPFLRIPPCMFENVMPGIDFMRPFPSSQNNKYILVAIDYVSIWVEVEALSTNDARVVVKFLRKLFSRFGVPKALISDRGTHFCNSLLEKTLKKYEVTHRLETPYHLQTNGQTENTNRAIKRILERTVNGNRKEWADKLDDALWAFRTAYKAPIRSTPFRIVYGKACHLPLKMEHKAYWASRK
ncbi:reverse transcriptase domain-containing protein [Tanacetum coccineum]